jgi:hypothetical protein
MHLHSARLSISFHDIDISFPQELEESDTDVPVASSAPATSPISTAPPSPSLVAEEFDFFESDGWPAEDMEIEGN